MIGFPGGRTFNPKYMTILLTLLTVIPCLFLIREIIKIIHERKDDEDDFFPPDIRTPHNGALIKPI
jgi:hypothetical protein